MAPGDGYTGRLADSVLADLRSDLVCSPIACELISSLTRPFNRVILPLLGEFLDSGYRTPKDRMIYSLRSNGRYQLIVFGSASVGLVYVLYQNGFDGSSVKGLVMALAYCWGLILAISLMGHGLVAIPRRLLRDANISGRLRRLQCQAPKIHDRLTDAVLELEELDDQVLQLKRRKNGISSNHKEWIEELVESTDLPESRISTGAVPKALRTPIPAVLTDRYLADLTRKLNRARHKRVRFIHHWDRLAREAGDVQAILDSSASKQLDWGRSSPRGSFLGRWTFLTPYTRYLLYRHVAPAARVVCGIFLALASVCIVWSELVKFIAPQLSVVSLTVVQHKNEIGFWGQLASSAWLIYMTSAALTSFQVIQVWGNRALVPRGTYPESACWYSSQVAKLTVPLAYNFITFFPRDIHRKTTYYQFLGRLINLTPLGKGFDYFFPIFILVPVCATLFNLYGKIQNALGFGIVEDDEEDNPSGFGTGGWREGRALIERELNRNTDLSLPTHPGGASSLLGPRARSPIGLSGTGRGGDGRALPGDRPSASLHLLPDHQPQRSAQRPAASVDPTEDDEETFFQGFAHRLRNTIDTASKPRWLDDLGDGFKRPKWMGGAGGDNEASGRADAGRGLGRWFGGRPSDGALRL